MSKNKDAETKQATKKGGISITVDTQCPYCQGRRGHSFSQRKACKSKGAMKPEAAAKK